MAVQRTERNNDAWTTIDSGVCLNPNVSDETFRLGYIFTVKDLSLLERLYASPMVLRAPL